jgi:3-deoxy-D-manno-octulosonic-acid transferase
VLYLVLIAGFPFFVAIGLMRGKWLANFGERMGLYRAAAGDHDLWIHAVSVGESLAAKPVVDAIERIRPGTSIVFTTTTATGQVQAKRLFPRATVTWFPLDFSFAVRRFLARFRPRVFATMETEIWPNATRLSRAAGLRLVLANGRISDRSYPRYRAFRGVVSSVLRRYDRVLAREEADRERFVAIGAPPPIVEVTGNVKFDYTPDPSPLPIAADLERLVAGRRVAVLGSTLEGEDEMLLQTIVRLVRDHGLFVVVAPRKPERFDPVARLLASGAFRIARRSAIQDAAAADVLVVDTLGELARLYRYADAAFVGGSLVPAGGHNPIEPAAAGVPVCFGPSMSNFREIAAVFLRHDAASQVANAAELEEFVVRVTGDDALRRAMGERARAAVDANRGASERTARRIVELLS